MKSRTIRSLSFLSVFALVFAISCSKKEEEPPPPSNPGGGTGEEGTTPIVYENDINTAVVFTNHKDGVDYEICGNIVISAKLEIEEGVEILMCEGASITFNENGVLKAIGTASNPITIKGKESRKGFWDYISIASDSANLMEYVNISDGGNNYKTNDPNTKASVFILGSSNKFGQLGIKNSKVSNGSGTGIIVEEGGLLSTFNNNTITSVSGAPIQLPFSAVGALDEASSYDGATEKYIDVTESSTISALTIKKLEVPYLINGRNWIYNHTRINAGVDIIMGENARLLVDKYASLNAVGTANDPITINGKKDEAGYWDLIRFESDDARNQLKFVEIRNGGGYGQYDYATIYVKGDAGLEITDCDISNSYQWALFAEAGANLNPAEKADIENQNNFSGNGSGVNATCNQRDCNVYIEP